MSAKLSKEQRELLHSTNGDELEVVDETTNKVYVIVTKERWQSHQSLDPADLAAIQRGIDDLEAGRVLPLQEADDQLREQLGFPHRQ